MRTLRFALAALGAVLFALPASAAGFGDWAAIVVSADNHSHSGAPSEVFDNGRHDVAADLIKLGFAPNNLIQFSVASDAHPGTDHADKQTIANELWDLSNRTTGGCFIYFTSHGSPDGIVLDEGVFSPNAMHPLIDNSCRNR